ncbi:hypothetical protein LJR234_006650 [Mesorhizobium amorphae]|uniref:HEPN domain-containing protein n=1 Tax=Mesorhizobium amorphae TaxID=71433 RepID=UPI003ECFA1AE
MAKDSRAALRRARIDRSTVLKKKRYRGQLAIGGETMDVRFTLSAKADCRLRFKFDPMNGPGYVRLIQSMGKPGQPSQHFSIDARNRSGDRVVSDTLSVIGVGRGAIEAGYLTATVTTLLKEPIPKPILRLYFRGFSSFRNSVVETPLGTLAVAGATNPKTDEMSGYVLIRAPDVSPGDDWRAKADDFLRHMHQGLAFAHGGRLQTPRLDYIEGKNFAATFISGSGWQPEFPVQYSLNQDPIIAALVHRYFNGGPISAVIWIALRWMQSGTTVDEVRFLTAMTALEAIIESELPAKKGTIIPKSEFKALRQKLMEVIDQHPGLTQVQRDIFKKRTEGNNKKTLPEKIDALFDHYKISRRDFDQSTLAALVTLRNKIVHTGVLPDEVDIWESIILVRELITRILLSEIGFRGRYCCYIGGQHDRDFPDL